MTIQEAFNSGRPFRRPGRTWLTTANFPFGHGDSVISIESILADDWEIQPEVIEFECEWNCKKMKLGGIPYDVSFPDNFELAKLKPLVGKRTRVRIEVIE